MYDKISGVYYTPRSRYLNIWHNFYDPIYSFSNNPDISLNKFSVYAVCTQNVKSPASDTSFFFYLNNRINNV